MFASFAPVLGHRVGVVKVQVVIAAYGQIKEVKVIGGHSLLVNAVEKALQNWKYAPSNGETTASLEFSFHPKACSSECNGERRKKFLYLKSSPSLKNSQRAGWSRSGRIPLFAIQKCQVA